MPWHGSKPSRTQADQQRPIPTSSPTPTGDVEPGAHPTRQPGHDPAQHYANNPQRPTS